MLHAVSDDEEHRFCLTEVYIDESEIIPLQMMYSDMRRKDLGEALRINEGMIVQK